MIRCKVGKVLIIHWGKALLPEGAAFHIDNTAGEEDTTTFK